MSVLHYLLVMPSSASSFQGGEVKSHRNLNVGRDNKDATNGIGLLRSSKREQICRHKDPKCMLPGNEGNVIALREWDWRGVLQR